MRPQLLAVLIAVAACGKVVSRDPDAGTTDDGDMVDMGLSGPAQLVVEPLDHMFGPVPLSTTSAAVTFTFRNTGGEPATGCSAPVKGGANPTAFTIVNDNCGTADLASGATCTVEVSATPTNDAMITMTLSRACTAGGPATTSTNAIEANRPMYIFVTSTESNANLGGLAGADSKCNVLGIAGSVTAPKNLAWKALLSQSTGTPVHAKDRFVWTGPVFDTTGKIVTRNPSIWPWTSNPTGGEPQYDENGVTSGSYTWTATALDGTALSAKDCVGWTSAAAADKGRAGQTGSYPNVDWLDSFDSNCDGTFYGLYCVSQ